MQTLFDKHAAMIVAAADLDKPPDIDAPADDTDDGEPCRSCFCYGCWGCDGKPPANRIRQGQAK